METKALYAAFNYVNNRYLFNSKNYPALSNLSPEAQKVFAINHSLLHMQKNIYQIIRCEQYQLDAKIEISYKVAMIKMVVNLIKLAEVLGFTKEEFANFLPGKSAVKTPAEVLLELMKDLATECERFDHESQFDYSKIEQSFRNKWMEFQAVFRFGNQKLSLNEACSLIPEVMKSK